MYLHLTTCLLVTRDGSEAADPPNVSGLTCRKSDVQNLRFTANDLAQISEVRSRTATLSVERATRIREIRSDSLITDDITEGAIARYKSDYTDRCLKN